MATASVFDHHAPVARIVHPHPFIDKLLTDARSVVLSEETEHDDYIRVILRSLSDVFETSKFIVAGGWPTFRFGFTSDYSDIDIFHLTSLRDLVNMDILEDGHVIYDLYKST